MQPVPHGPTRIPTVLLVVSLVLPACLGAQEADRAFQDTGIHPFRGFAGVPWGAYRDTIEAIHGEAPEVNELTAIPAVTLTYPDLRLDGRPGAAGFLVHAEEGLIRGQLLLPYGQGDDCWQLFTRWRDALDAALPDARRRQELDRGPEDLDFCTSFQLGQASAAVEWRDPDSGALVGMRLDLETGVLRVSYESPAFGRISVSGDEGAPSGR